MRTLDLERQRQTRYRGMVVAVIGALIAAALGLSVWLPPTPANVAIIGDSITVFSAADLSEALGSAYHVDIRAQNGKRIDEMLPALRDALRRHPDAVVVNLGTNDALQGGRKSDWRASFHRMISLLTPEPCVVLTTINTRVYSPTADPAIAAELNQSMVTAAAEYPNFHALDWNAVAYGPNSDSLFIADHIHPTGAGELTLAMLTRHALDSDCRSRGA